ncbi:MAG TPA: hypothetical protein VKZ85_11730 [Woeseiaceae bacterium]|nr:hypothetical protein [Woeseiaceae bacterium]
MDKRIIGAAGALFLVPATAAAYVGPGAGLSLLGALWALLVALGTALLFIIAWPVRRILRRKRQDRARAARDREREPTREEDTAHGEGDEPLPSKRP